MMTIPVVILVIFLSIAFAVDRSKFRTCDDTGFCKRYRHRAAPQASHDQFQVRPGTVKERDGHVIAALIAPEAADLTLELFFLVDGAVRMKISEDSPRWQPSDLLLPAGLTCGPVLRAALSDLPSVWQTADPLSFSAFVFATPMLSPPSRFSQAAQEAQEEERNVLVLTHAPFSVLLYRNGEQTVAVNEQQLMHFEQSQASQQVTEAVVEAVDRHQGKEVLDYGEDGLAIYTDGSREEKASATTPSVTASSTTESFGGHLDTMPKGARSVGIDLTFASSAVYGLPSHTLPLALPDTTNTDPIRLYNLDVFEYELDTPMALYGHIPVLFAKDSGVFLFNPSELFIDIKHTPTGTQTHWMAESGLLDVFLLPGRAAHGQDHAAAQTAGQQPALLQYMSLTGGQAMAPMFALGYHQCRWNYRDEKDVVAVNVMFEELDYPYDVLWLDIEHTLGKRYFTWDKTLFPNPLSMQQNLSAIGRKMVTIIDPHLKRDDSYSVHTAALAGNHYIKDKHGAVYEGWCWPGASSYLDFTSPAVRGFWAEQFALDRYADSTLDLFTWNDMNEPSVFNGPEVSMPKDSLNTAGIEHREWHNLYGLYMQMATAQGQVARSAGTLRPFVLTRAFWAGSQRYGAMWTGDNTATWEHLRISIPMLLSINMAGLSFAGADVGGFFRDTESELFVRWYQAGAFTPFFRGHAHHDTQRKEPWVYGEPYTSINRATALLRYSLLPYWYTVMQEAYEFGVPVMRPVFWEFPAIPALATVENAFFVGDSLLVAPVLHPQATEITVAFPMVGSEWYDLQTMQQVAGSASVSQDSDGIARVTLPVQLSTVPVFLRPGSILPRKLRLRRSSKLMFHDPYTLFIAPNTASNTAQGVLYMDDETTFGYEQGLFAHRLLIFVDSVITCKAYKSTLHPIGYRTMIQQQKSKEEAAAFEPSNTIERIVIAGQQAPPKKVLLLQEEQGEQARELQFTMEGSVLTIKKPDVLAARDWQIKLQY